MQSTLQLFYHEFKSVKLDSSTSTATSGWTLQVSSRLFVLYPLTNIQCLIDPGDNLSVYPYKPDFQPIEPQYLAAATDTKMNVYGAKLIRLDLGLRRNFDHIFLQASVTKPIIGAEFLKKFRIMVALRGRRLVDSTSKLQAYVIVLADPSPKQFAVESNLLS